MLVTDTSFYRGKFVLVHDLKACRSGCTSPYILKHVALWRLVMKIMVWTLAPGYITPVGVE